MNKDKNTIWCLYHNAGSDSSQSGQISGNPNLGILTSADNDSGEEDDEDADLVTENSEYVSCLHQGKIYKDGESFTANVSGLPISMVDQCMQCICQVSYVSVSFYTYKIKHLNFKPTHGRHV